jgi:glycogen operon protein
MPPPPHLEWHVLLDTANPEAPPAPLATPDLEVPAHSMVVLAAQPTGDADWQASWRAGAQYGPRLLTALPPDPGTSMPDTEQSG